MSLALEIYDAFKEDEFKATESRIIKWSFLFWLSQMSVFIALGFAILKALNVI